MSSPDELRRKLNELARKRAAEEKKASDAQSKAAKKNREAASRHGQAGRSSSDSQARSHLRAAEQAEAATRKEQEKAAKHGSTIAKYMKEEADLRKRLTEAERRQARVDERARKQREDADRRERERQRAEDQRQAADLVAGTEARLTDEIARVRPPKPEPLRILYLTASPEGDMRVDEEMRRVKRAVRAATHRDLVEIEHMPAATASDLLDGLASHTPHVVHFSGHAAPTFLVFDTGGDEPNQGHEVTADSFAKAMSAVDEPPVLVVLNACESEDQLDGLLCSVPVAIGMSDQIGDPDAMAFAARFYSNVAEGQSVQSAWEAARLDMEMHGLPDADLPVLRSRAGVDAADVRLVVPPEK